MIGAIVFDVGETLIDETRQWSTWADWLDVPRDDFLTALEEVIGAGHDHRRVFDRFAPGLDIAAAERAREQAGCGYRIEQRDFYPDTLACLATLRAAGYRIGIAGNQPEAAEVALSDCGVDADLIASSARWGVEKPSPAFFERIIREIGLPPSQIVYIGDRLDNDVLPALHAGMHAIFLERGPWGRAHAKRPEVAQASCHLTDLAALPTLLIGLSGR